MNRRPLSNYLVAFFFLLLCCWKVHSSVLVSTQTTSKRKIFFCDKNKKKKNFFKRSCENEPQKRGKSKKTKGVLASVFPYAFYFFPLECKATNQKEYPFLMSLLAKSKKMKQKKGQYVSHTKNRRVKGKVKQKRK